MYRVSKDLFDDYVKENNLERVFSHAIDCWVYGFSNVYNYVDRERNVKAKLEEGNQDEDYYFINDEKYNMYMDFLFVSKLLNR